MDNDTVLMELHFKNDFDWFVKYTNPYELHKNHLSYVLCQMIFLIGAIILFLHALKKRGRWPYLYVAAIGIGIMSEVISILLPDVNNYWHSNSFLIFAGRRLPLHIILLYPVFYYHASWAVSKLKLKCPFVEHLAVGILVVLIDLPFDIIGVKFLHWTWHDTDPNLADRHYWVPWNAYYFQLTFAASFSFLFHKTRSLFVEGTELNKWEAGSFKSEIISAITAGVFGMPLGCLLFVPTYHPLHDYLGISTEVIVVTIVSIILVLIWKFDRKSNRYTKPEKLDFLSKALLIHLFMHYVVFLMIAIFLNPEDIAITGLREPIGDCNETVDVHTILKTLIKKKYLCTTDYDEAYFDFHCLPNQQPPTEGVWYKICGTPFENRVEYIVVLSLISFIAYIVFSTIYFDYDSRLLKLLPKQEMERETNKNKKVKRQ